MMRRLTNRTVRILWEDSGRGAAAMLQLATAQISGQVSVLERFYLL